jgi:hypothetical protein
MNNNGERKSIYLKSELKRSDICQIATTIQKTLLVSYVD